MSLTEVLDDIGMWLKGIRGGVEENQARLPPFMPEFFRKFLGEVTKEDDPVRPRSARVAAGVAVDAAQQAPDR